MIRLVPTVALALLLMLAGCDTSSAPKAGATASGEVLPGTVSDAMLSTDRSQAESPLAPAVQSAASKESAAAGSASSESVPNASSAAESPPVAETPTSPKPAAP